MRKFTYLISILALIYTGSLCAKDFKQGQDYYALGNPVSKAQQITEFFSFYCPACFRFEPFMESVKAKMAQPENFIKNHVTQMPGRDEKVETLLSKALVTARLLKVESKLNKAIFEYIHISKANFSNEKDVRQLFLLHGVKPAEFDKTFASFKVKAEAKRMAKRTQKIRDKGYSAVPTLVINNNYVPNVKSVKSYDEYLELITYLLSLGQ